MYKVLVSSVIALTLSVVVVVLGIVLAMSSISDREKNSPFECGFDPINSARLPFSLRFFLLAIIFLIFDVEVVLLFPLLVATKISFTLSVLGGGFIFLLVVSAGLFYEWWEGSLDWAQ